MYCHAVSFNVGNRKIHHYASFVAALPLLIIIVSGLLLQMKKQWDWVQPPEHRGTGTTPVSPSNVTSDCGPFLFLNPWTTG